MKTLNFNFPAINYEKVVAVHAALMSKAPQQILDIAVQYFGQSQACDRVSVTGFIGVKVLSPAMAQYSPAGIEITPNGAFLHLTSEFLQKLMEGNDAVTLIVGHEYGHMIDMAAAADIDSYELNQAVEIRCDLFAMEHFRNISSCKLIQLFTVYLNEFRSNPLVTVEHIEAFEEAILPRIEAMKAFL